jgi:hypothetical protein
MCVVIPVLLLGAKYILDQSSQHRAQLYSSGSETVHKKCAQEAALAAARCWNPALTLKQQKESLLRVVDDVYNGHPCHYDGAAVHAAIPGLELRRVEVTSGGEYDPLRMDLKSSGDVVYIDRVISPTRRVVEYRTV